MSRSSSTFRRADDPTLDDGARSRASEAARRIVEEMERRGAADLHSAIRDNPGVLEDRSVLFDLVQEEFHEFFDEWAGLTPNDFCHCFPQVDEELLASLHRLIEVHQVLGGVRTSDLLRLTECVGWPTVGELFGDFELAEELGRGAMSRVFLCREASLGDRPVVLKVTQAAKGEANVLGKLHHPNVVPVHSTGTESESGLDWICMPFLGRRTLQDVIFSAFKKGQPDSSEPLRPRPRLATVSHWLGVTEPYAEGVVSLFAELADGLAYVHESGLLHGDLKPSNILQSDDGVPMLIDFNLAQRVDSDSGLIGGTLPYMAPEQLEAIVSGDATEGCRITRASESFAFGVVLYQTLSGTLPFVAETDSKELESIARELLASQESWEFGSQCSIRGVDRRLVRLLERCFAPDPEDRPTEFGEIHCELTGLLTTSSRLARLARRRPLGSTVTVVGMLALSAITAVAIPASREAALISRAQSLVDDGRYGQAIKLLGPYLNEHQEDVLAHRMMATSLLHRGEPKAAAEEFMHSWRAEKLPLDIAMIGYCQNLSGEHALATRSYELAKEGGLVLPSIENNLAVSFLIGLESNFDDDVSKRVTQLLLGAYRLAPSNETIRLSMLRHYLFSAERSESVRPEYPIEISEAPFSDASLEFSTKSAWFLVLRSSNKDDLQKFGLPNLERVSAFRGFEAIESTLGVDYLKAYQPLDGYQELSLTPRSFAPDKPPEFLNPASDLEKS